MISIRDYFADEARWEEEVELWETMENDVDDEFDLTAWAAERGIDLTIRDERLGETVLTLWTWDMCGD